MRKLKNYIKISKKGFSTIEYIMMGAVLILGAISVQTYLQWNIQDEIVVATNTLSDEDDGILSGDIGSPGKLTEQIILSEDNIVIPVGNDFELSAVIMPDYLYGVNLQWKDVANEEFVNIQSSNNGFSASLDAKKKSSDIGNGKQQIIVTTDDGSNASATLTYETYVAVGYGWNLVNPRIKSNETAEISIGTSPSSEWDHRSVVFTIVSGGGNNLHSIEIKDHSVVINPKSLVPIVIKAEITDELLNKTYTLTNTIKIEPVYPNTWYTEPTNREYEIDREEYNVTKQTGEYPDEWLEEEDRRVGEHGEKSKKQYLERIATWTNWLKVDPGNVPDKEHDYLYEYRDVSSWGSTIYGSKPDVQYYAINGSQRKTVKSWSSWSTSKPSGAYTESASREYTSHGSKSLPTGGLGNAGSKTLTTQYFGGPVTVTYVSYDVDVMKDNWSNYSSPVLDVYCDSTHIGSGGGGSSSNNMSMSMNRTCSSIRIYSRGDTGSGRNLTFANNGTIEYHTTSRRTEYRYVTSWNSVTYSASPCVVNSGGNYCNNQTVYKTPAAYSSWVGTRINTPYVEDSNTDIRTIDGWRYKIWPAWTNNWVDQRPASSGMNEIRTKTVYKYPIWGTVGDWVECPKSGNEYSCPINEIGLDERYENRTSYNYPIFT